MSRCLQTAGHSVTLNNPTYDCANDSLPPGSNTENNPMVTVNQNTEGDHTYHELEPVLHHSAGPNMLSQGDTFSDSEAHIYDMEVESDDEPPKSPMDGTYEHSSLSELS